MPFCSLCQSLGSWIVAQFLVLEPFCPSDSYPHHPSWQALQESSSHGCDSCSYMIRCLMSSPLVTNYAEYIAPRLEAGEKLPVNIRVSKTPDEDKLLIHCCIQSNVEIYVPPNDPAAAFIHSRPGLASNPNDPSFIRFISGWLADCERLHPKCKIKDDGFFPTRLVDVGSPDGSEDPRLIETMISEQSPSRNNLDSRVSPISYITLSHCWGRSRHIKTTQENIQNHKHAIPISNLNRLYQDTIAITRSLGFRYVWIDSLCIIQDSDEDWAYESSRVGKVYMNGMLNLMTTMSKNGDEEFLVNRPDPFRFPYTIIHQGHELTGEIRANSDQTSSFQGNRHNALTTRAWVVQERALSPRLLYFNRFKVTVECYEYLVDEDRPDANNFPMVTHFDPTIEVRMRMFPGMLRDETGASAPEKFRAWHDIVEYYSSMHLYRSTDKLPAISGLATEMQQSVSDEYLAGLWRKDLPQALFWTSHGLGTNYGVYQAPSWSWAAQTFGVLHLGDNYSQLEWVNEIRILDAGVTCKGVNKLGEVTAGFIKIFGPMLKVKAVWDGMNRRAILSEARTGQFLGFSFIDNMTVVTRDTNTPGRYVSNSIIDTELWCFIGGFLKTGNGNERSREFGRTPAVVLLLNAVSHDIFRRVGIMYGVWVQGNLFSGMDRMQMEENLKYAQIDTPMEMDECDEGNKDRFEKPYNSRIWELAEWREFSII